MIMLLIHNDQPQVGKRQEDGRPRPQNDAVLSGIFRIPLPCNIFPHLRPFIAAVTGVVNTHFIAEIPAQPCNDLGGERNLRKKIEHLFATIECFPDQLDVQLGLSSGCNSMKQHHTMILKFLMNQIISFFLM